MPRQTKTNIYCGIKKNAPKGKKLGSMEECAQIGQLRRWGTKKVPKELMMMMLEVASRKKLLANERRELKRILEKKEKPKRIRTSKSLVEKRKMKPSYLYKSTGRVEAPAMFRLNLKNMLQPENVPLPLSPKAKPAKSKVLKKQEEYELIFNHPNVEILTPYFKNKSSLKSALVGKTNKQQILKSLITTLNKAKTTRAIENFMDKYKLSN